MRRHDIEIPDAKFAQFCRAWKITELALFAVCDILQIFMPSSILAGETKRRQPYPGDHDIQFEPIDGLVLRLLDASQDSVLAKAS